MKQSVVKEMTDEELRERLENETEALSKLRMNHTITPLENPMVLREKRRAIARLKTEIKKRADLAAVTNE
jgi:large subunit ribosomal protein L29